MAIFSQPTFYIINDVERALWPGWENDPHYYIVTYRNPYSEWLADQKRNSPQPSLTLREGVMQNPPLKIRGVRGVMNLFLVDGKKGSTEELMKHSQVIKFIKSESQKVRKSEKQEINIIVFKPTVEVEEYCKKMGWKILNPSSRFAEQFEEKIAQTALFKKLTLRTPKTIVGEVGDFVVRRGALLYVPTRETVNLPAVLQFNLGHTGEGTYLIRHESDLKTFQKQFPKRPVRVSEFIRGVPVTVNGVVGKRVYGSAPSLQITGIPTLTALPFATVGNDWTYASQKVYKVKKSIKSEIRRIVQKIGNELKKKGYRGAFGVDLVVGDDKRVYVIETNIRQVNSCVYESYLQIHQCINASMHQPKNFKFDVIARSEGCVVRGTTIGRSRSDAQNEIASQSLAMTDTTMTLYFKCLLGRDTGKETLPKTLEGAQVFVRAQDDIRWGKKISPKHNGKYFYFSKLNKGDSVKKNVEVLRIQSKGGMVDGGVKLKNEVNELLNNLDMVD